MRLPLLYKLGLHQPWSIDPTYASTYMPLLARLLKGEMPAADSDHSADRLRNRTYFITPSADHDDWDDDWDDDEDQENIDLNEAPKGSIAVMRLSGVVVKNSQWCGPRGTLDYAEDLKLIDNDDNYIGTIFKIESGGGEAYAVHYLTRVMANLKKPVVILAGNIIASAAYFIGSYADEIIADHPRSIVGSIGTMLSMQNIQPALEKLGVEFHEIYATDSTLKNKDYNDALEGKYDKIRTEFLDPINNDFIAEVKEQRPMIADNKAIFQGETFLANVALDLKMIDHIGDMELAIQRVQALSNSSNNPKSNMKFTNVAALAGVENATEAQLEQANADLTAAGITNVTLVPDSLVSEAEQVTTERDNLQNQVNSLTTERGTASASLATAQTDLETAQARVTELEAENKRLGSEPGAEHNQSVGKDEPAGTSDDEEYEKLAANMAHNRKADSIF